MSNLSKAMHWLINGETGLSSECMMATILNGGPISGNYKARFHPLDPADFERCIKLLEAVPELRENLIVMKDVSLKWATLIDHWDELENLYNQERNQRSAPKLYERMKELFQQVEEAKADAEG